jgi:hypothetical protein
MAGAERHEEVWYDLNKITQEEKDALIWFYNSSCRDLWDKLPNGAEENRRVRIVANLLRELDSKERRHNTSVDNLRRMGPPKSVSLTYDAD